MPEMNPYAPPLADTAPPIYAAKAAPPEGMWQMGRVLVMHRDARFPVRCVKSNGRVEGYLTRNLSWHHPAIALSIILGLLVYVILALVLTKRATIQVPLSAEWFARRRNAIIVGWSIGLAGIALFVGAFFVPERVAVFICLPMLLGGIVAAIGGLAYGALMSRIVWPSKIDDHYIYLKGVNRGLLATLPHWRGP